MSYILDALKRAQAERGRGSVPGLHTQSVTMPSAKETPERSSGNRGAWLIAGAAGAAGVAAGAAGFSAGLAASATGGFTAGVAAVAGFLVVCLDSLATVVPVGSFFFGISSVL